VLCLCSLICSLARSVPPCLALCHLRSGWLSFAVSLFGAHLAPKQESECARSAPVHVRRLSVDACPSGAPEGQASTDSRRTCTGAERAHSDSCFGAKCAPNKETANESHPERK